MKRVLSIAIGAVLLALPAARAEKMIDRRENGYLLHVPAIDSDRRHPVIVVLPGNHMPPRLEYDSWVFHSNRRGFALIAIDPEYPKGAYSEKDLKRVQARIRYAVKEAARHFQLDRKRVFLAGTSRGGMMALSLALRYPDDFKAIGVASGGFAKGDIDKAHLAAAKDKPFFFVHGEQDRVVALERARAARNLLETNGGHVQWHVEPDAGHALSKTAYRRLVEWMAALP